MIAGTKIIHQEIIVDTNQETGEMSHQDHQRDSTRTTNTVSANITKQPLMTQETVRFCNDREKNRTDQSDRPIDERSPNMETSTSHTTAAMIMTVEGTKATGEATTGTGASAIIPTADAQATVTNREGTGRKRENLTS
jgi:hypothetical protein